MTSQSGRSSSMTPDEIQHLFQLIDAGLTNNQILDVWEVEFDRPPLKRRMVANYRARFVERMRAGAPRPDDPVLWGNLSYLMLSRVPESKLPLVSDVATWAEFEFRGLLPPTTYRQCTWISYVALYAPEMTEALDLYCLGSLFSLRSKVAAYVKDAPNLSDLESYLRYRPWRGGSSASRYLAARNAGLIRPLRSTTRWFNPAIDRLFCERFDGLVSVMAPTGIPYIHRPILDQSIFLEFWIHVINRDPHQLPSEYTGGGYEIIDHSNMTVLGPTESVADVSSPANYRIKFDDKAILQYIKETENGANDPPN